MPRSQFGWRYPNGDRVCIGDRIEISRPMAKQCNVTDRSAIVVADRGFVTAELCDGTTVDLDMRNFMFVSRRPAED